MSTAFARTDIQVRFGSDSMTRKKRLSSRKAAPLLVMARIGPAMSVAAKEVRFSAANRTLLRGVSVRSWARSRSARSRADQAYQRARCANTCPVRNRPASRLRPGLQTLVAFSLIGLPQVDYRRREPQFKALHSRSIKRRSPTSSRGFCRLRRVRQRTA